MYGALELPMTWLYAWFSIITTMVWSGVGTLPAALAVPPIPTHTPAAAAARPTADARAVRVRRAGLPARGNTWTSGWGTGWGPGAVPRQSVNAPDGPKQRSLVNRPRTFGKCVP